MSKSRIDSKSINKKNFSFQETGGEVKLVLNRVYLYSFEDCLV